MLCLAMIGSRYPPQRQHMAEKTAARTANGGRPSVRDYGNLSAHMVLRTLHLWDMNACVIVSAIVHAFCYM